ncbi:ABC transporter permease [bacterium]|nr:ABC transporter permease [bacterium]
MKQLFMYLVGLCVLPDYRQIVQGDFEEDFDEIRSHSGVIKAVIWSLLQVIISLKCKIIFHLGWSLSMLKNYIKIAFRHMNKHRSYSLINIIGLALGMICSIYILLWVSAELDYDRFHSRSDRICFIETEMKFPDGSRIWPSTPAQLAEALHLEYPQIEEGVTVKKRFGTYVQFGDISFKENAFYGVSDKFFTMFDFPIVEGNAQDLFSDPYSIFISESAAFRYFGDQSPIGQTIILNRQHAVTVKGIMKDFPVNTHMKMNFIIPFNTLKIFGENLDDWGRYDFRTYILLKDGVDVRELNKKIEYYLKRHRPDSTSKFRLIPLERVHLHSVLGSGNIIYVRLFSLIGLIMLIVAAINFVNLSTARATLRGREVGIRKVVGAQKKDLLRQLLGESLIYSFISFLIAIIVVIILLPGFNNISGKDFDISHILTINNIFGLLGIVIITGVLSGIYPAFYMSGFNPLRTLNQGRQLGGSGRFLRKILVVLQFSVSIILIIGTLIILSQINFIRNKNLGFNKENILFVPLNHESRKMVDVLMAELISEPDIIEIAASDQVPVNQGNFTTISRWDGNQGEKRVLFHGMSANAAYFDLFGMDIIKGRSFIDGTEDHGLIINEEAVRQMGLTDPIGTRISYWNYRNVPIIGVVKDYHFKPLHNAIKPLFIQNKPNRFNMLIMRISGENIQESISSIQKAVQKVSPDYPFSYYFIDERIARMYRTEIRTAQLLKVFTAIIILTSCLGLFGLAAFTAQNRIKEIGIRKTLGASVASITFMLSREFIYLVLLGNVLAWPAGYFFMHKWLQNFTYKIDMSIWIFFASAMVTIIIALSTVSFQAIRAALANPVKSLAVE